MAPKKKAAGDAGKGEKTFKNLCAICHAIGSHGTGPSLGGTFNGPVAQKEGFSYS